MKAPVKAVFFDIDGTMYYHGIHDFVSSTQKALWKLYEQGIKVGVATSRCHAEMANAPSFFRTFPFSGMVSDGGALQYHRREFFYERAASKRERRFLCPIFEFAANEAL